MLVQPNSKRIRNMMSQIILMINFVLAIYKERVFVERLCEVGCTRHEIVGSNIVDLAESKEGT